MLAAPGRSLPLPRKLLLDTVFRTAPIEVATIPLFGARVHFTGASFGFEASAVIGGSFAPIIATWLVAYMGGTAGVSAMLILLAALTLVATLFAHETKNLPLLK